MLGEVLGKVFSSFLSVQAELVLFDTAAHPAETHVESPGVLPGHVAGEDSVGGCAVGLHWGWRLRVAHFDEGRAYGNILLDVEENRSSFGLCGRSHDSADGLTFGEYQFVRCGSGSDVGRWWIVTYVVVSHNATASFGLDEIRCVNVDVEAHVASVEPDDGVQLCGFVVDEHLCLLDGVGGG